MRTENVSLVNTINLEEYRSFLKFQGLSEDEVNAKVELLKQQQTFLMTQREAGDVVNIGSTEHLQATPLFGKLKNAFMPLFNKAFSRELLNGNTVINKTVVSGLVTQDFLTSENYKSFLAQAQELAENLGVELRTSSKSLKDGLFENIFYAKGIPANVNQFTQDFLDLAETNNLRLNGLSEHVQKIQPKLDEKYVPQSQGLDFSTSEEISSLESADDEEIKPDFIESKKDIEEIYLKKFGFKVVGSKLEYPNFYDKTDAFIFSQAVKGYKKVAKEISEEMLRTSVIKQEVLNSYSNKKIHDLLESVKKVNPGFLYSDVIKSLKTDDFYSFPKVPELDDFLKNKDKINEDMKRNESLLSSNQNRLNYLTQALNNMLILSKTISDKNVKKSKKIDWEISLNLPLSVFSKGVSYITPGKYYKKKLENQIENLTFPDGKTFSDVKEAFLNIHNRKTSFTAAEKVLNDKQYSSLNDLRERVNEKVIVIGSDFENHVKKLREMQGNGLEKDLTDFLVLAQRVDSLSLNEEKKLKELKDKFEAIKIEMDLFFEDNKENVEQLQDMERAYQKILNPIQSNLSNRELRKRLIENESKLSGLSQVGREAMVSGVANFMQKHRDQMWSEMSLLKEQVNQAMNPSIISRIEHLELTDEIKVNKHEILTKTRSPATVRFLNEYLKMEQLINDSFEKAQGVGKYSTESDPERKQELDTVYARVKKVLDNPEKSYDPKYLKQLNDKMDSLMSNEKAGLTISEINEVENKIHAHLKKMEWFLTVNPEIKNNLAQVAIDVSPTLYSHANKDNILASLHKTVQVTEFLKTLKPIDTNGFEDVRPQLKERLDFENQRVIEQEKMHTVKYVKPVKAKKMADELKERLANLIENDGALNDSVVINKDEPQQSVDEMFPSSDDIQVGDGSTPQRVMKRSLKTVSRNPRT